MLGFKLLKPSVLGSICMCLYCRGAHTCLTDDTIGAHNRTSSCSMGILLFSVAPDIFCPCSGTLVNNLSWTCQCMLSPRCVHHSEREPSGTGHQTNNPKCTATKGKQPQTCSVSGCLLHPRPASQLTLTTIKDWLVMNSTRMSSLSESATTGGW